MTPLTSATSNGLTGKGLTQGLNHRVSYLARNTNNAGGINGNSWIVTEMARLSYSTALEDGNPAEVMMIAGKSGTVQFEWDTGTQSYVGLNGTFSTLEIASTANADQDIAIGDFVVMGARGKKWVFHPPSESPPPNLGGRLKSRVQGNGVVTLVSYDQNLSIASMEKSLEGDQLSAGLYYTIADSGDHQGRILAAEQRISRGGIVTPTKRWSYTYYASDEDYGSLNDLKTAEIEIYNGQTAQWESLGVTYYRYYLASSGIGFQHGLQYVVKPEDYARMVSFGIPPEDATDTQIAAHATRYLEYNSDRRVTKRSLRGGTYTETIAHLDSVNDPNWGRREIVTRPDGATETTYFSALDQVVLKILKDGGDSYPQYSVYDSNFQLIEEAGPDAINSFTEPATASDDYSVTLKTNEGLILVSDYYPESGGGAGSAPRYRKSRGVKEGSAGTLVKQLEYTYVAHTEGGETSYELASQIEYQSDASGGSDPATTSYAYTWPTGSFYPEQKTVTLPVISTGQNGTGQTYTVVDRYDIFGNRVWIKDEIGVLVYQIWDVVTGALLRRIEDVDTSEMNPSAVPDGWITPSGGGLHLTTDYEADAHGRNLMQLGPLHVIDLDGVATQVRQAQYRVYLDGRRQDWMASGYAVGDGYRTLGPVRVMQRNYRGQLTDEIAVTIPEDGRIDGGDKLPQSDWVKWTRHVLDDNGFVLATRQYARIPSSSREVDEHPVEGLEILDYLESQFGYDEMDRRNKSGSPGGTITRMVFDARSLRIEEWVGTDDSGATTADPSGNGAAGNNMKMVLANEYDDGQFGNPGNLIQETRPVDGTPTNDRVVDSSYDFRGRLVQTEVNDGSSLLISVSAYDNQDRLTSATGYHTSVASANRTSYSITSYDHLGRSYQSETFGVESNGDLTANALTTDRWYDPRGLEIKKVQPGVNGYAKVQFDTVRRQTASYLAYPQSGGLSGNSNDVSSDVVIEQNEWSYDDASNVLLTTSRQRFHDAAGTGPLLGPNGLEPLARVTYAAQWQDGIGRLIAEADYGTNGGNDFQRPELVPEPSDLVLVSRTYYAKSGEPGRTVAPDGAVTRVERDRLGRQIKMIENLVEGAPESDTGANRTTEYGYAPDGGMNRLVVRNIDTGDQVTQWEFGTTLADSGVARTDLLRRKVYPGDVSATGEVLQSIDYTYDRQGQTVGMTDANGTEHVYDLDKLGRLTQDRVVTLAAGIDGAVRRIATTYNNRGLATKVTSFDNAAVGSGSVVNEVERVYNAFNQMTEDRQEHDGAVDGSTLKVAYAYADASANTVRRTSVTYPSGKVVNISYGAADSTDDRLSRMAETAVGGEGSGLAQFTWMGLARLVKLNLPQPEVSLNYESLDSLTGDAGDPYVGYDRFGRTVDMRWIKNGGSDINRVQYGYDRASRRLWRQELAAPADKNQDQAWIYDGLGQVTSANRGVININRTAIGGVPAEGERFVYDPIGNWNRYQKLEDGLGTQDQTRVHNTDNQITQMDHESKDLAYDAAGNMTRTPVGVAKIVWDAWNRMIVAESDIQEAMATCVYDGLSRRTKLTDYGDLTEFYYNDVWKCVEEYENSGTSPSQIYYWGMRPGHRDELIRRGGGDSSVRWCVMDYFDPITILDEDGIPQERYGYTAFGEVEYYLANFAPKTSGFSDFNCLFHGQFRDAETGWYDYGYRYYVPSLGRWASRDPIGEKGGVNLFEFVGNNPTKFVDRFGLDFGAMFPGSTAGVCPDGSFHCNYEPLPPEGGGELNFDYPCSNDENTKAGEQKCNNCCSAWIIVHTTTAQAFFAKEIAGCGVVVHPIGRAACLAFAAAYHAYAISVINKKAKTCKENCKCSS